MGRARGRSRPRKHSKNLSNLFLFWFRGQPHHSSQQDRLDGPSPWALRAPETFENLSNLFLFCFRGQPHHSSKQDRLDGPRPWASWAPETFKNPVKSALSESSHIIPASRIGWMGRARGRPGPKKLLKSLSNLFMWLQRPATSFQPAGSVGWAEPKWVLQAPETLEKPVNPLYFDSEAKPLHSSQQYQLNGPSPW
jgi:hypothetical protein